MRRFLASYMSHVSKDYRVAEKEAIVGVLKKWNLMSLLQVTLKWFEGAPEVGFTAQHITHGGSMTKRKRSPITSGLQGSKRAKVTLPSQGSRLSTL
jgi:hypothetical protein